MKYIPNIVGGLLGFLFVGSAIAFFMMKPGDMPPPANEEVKHFMAAFAPTGYMVFVKVFEILGGILVAIPKTRNFGLLALGPIILNILAFHAFVQKDILDPKSLPMLAIMGLMALYLLFAGRKNFAALKN
ncbi:hypothetical protein [Haloferula sp. BvORR071]|uniref:hypothetical protein n=1 Tax=Haloferula sp. BvORR071 TaxID=1396141 RepID=UPI0006989F02|nr:hypothetical protein [Haloferula sp. BvORR071]